MRHRLALAIAAASAGLGPTYVSAASSIQASVNANGQVVLGSAPLTHEQAGTAKSELCPGTVPLAPEAAKVIVTRVATEEGFFPDFVLSVANIESHYTSTALSGRGAYGLMQLMPETARHFGVDLCDPADNVRGGIRLLRMLHARYRNPFFILAAYNAGEDALLRAKGVPPYPETVRFVADVINDFYAWPATAPKANGPAVLAKTGEPGIVEVGPDAAASSASPAAAPSWSDGFVLRID